MKRTQLAPGLLRCGMVAMFLATESCVLAWPNRATVGPPPAGLGGQEVAFASQSGSTIHAWLMPGRAGAGAVLLLHGVREDRRSMVGRARFSHGAGLTGLRPDCQ